MTDFANITATIERYFEDIEQAIFASEMFLPWRGAFEITKKIIKKENEDIKYDLDIRLKHWPSGISIKVYKHKALGVFCYVKDQSLCQQYLTTAPVPCKFWRDSFYFSNLSNLDDVRYVLKNGNDMQDKDTLDCIDRIKACIKETNTILD